MKRAILIALLAAGHLFGALAIDANVSANARLGATLTLSTPSFSTTSTDELLLAFFSWNGGNNTSGAASVSLTGAGLTWTLVKRQNTKAGVSEIWRAFAATTLSSQTVTVTVGTVPQGGATLVVMSFSGVDTTGTGGSGAIGATNGVSAVGAPSASLTTTRNASWVLGVGNDWDNGTARTVGSNQTMIHEFVDASDGDDAWAQRQTSTTATSGTSVTINDTAPTGDQYNLAIVEVLPGGAPPPPSTTCTISLLGAGPC